MKTQKKKIVQKQILSLLIEEKYVPVSFIANSISLSEKTIRTRIDEINDILVQKEIGHIDKVPGKGISLYIESGKKKMINSLINNADDNSFGEFRLYTYLRILLSNRYNKLTVTQLSKFTYDSIPVCNRHLGTCSEWLKMFGVDLSIRRNYGIILKGDEQKFRLAIKHLVINDESRSIDENIFYFARGINLSVLKGCIKDIENSWNFSFAEESYNSMLLFAALAITRNDIADLNLNKTESEIVTKYNEYQLSQSLFKNIEEKFMIEVSDDEIKYFAIQLLCSKMIHDENIDLDYGVRQYDSNIKEFVSRIISVVSNIINLDLTIDTELYYGLLSHIRPAIFRMRFEKHKTTTLTNFIQEEYKKTYRVSWALSVLFEEYYGIHISSTELSYITLYIQASIDRHRIPMNIVLVTELGMGLNQMFCNKIRLAIPKVENIKIVSLHDFKLADAKGFDLIISTSQLGHVDRRIIYVESLLSNQGIELIIEKINEVVEISSGNQRFPADCHNLFSPDLIFTNQEFQNKTDLIKMMADKLLENGFVNKKYYKSILEREKAVSTNIGNKVSIPHGNSNYVNQSKVVIVGLKEEIEWNPGERVKLVFLLGLQVNSKYESERTQQFYKSFLSLIDTDSDVDKLCKMSAEELYKYLIK